MKKNKEPKITILQLQNLVSDTREIINKYIKDNDMSVNAFSVMTGVHPNQMYMFLKMDRGLNLTTVQKIGDVLSKK